MFPPKKQKHRCELSKDQNVVFDEIKKSYRRFFIPDLKSSLTRLTLKSGAATKSEILRQYYHFPNTIHPLSKFR